MAFRVSTFLLDDKGERTPSGGLKVPARLARTGTQVYHKADGSKVVEYRPPEEVFSKDALASFAGAPLTDLHPAGAVTPENWSTLAKGHIGEDVKQDGDYVAATMYIQDQALIEAVQDGKRRELSAGYQVDIDSTPGEANGERYDRVQRNIVGNHVAALPPGTGRAGPDVTIRLDSADNEIYEPMAPPSREEEQMITIRVDGIDYQVEGPGAKTLQQVIAKSNTDLEKQVSDLTSERDSLQGRADSADKKIGDLTERVTHLESPAYLDGAAQKRASLIMDARAILSDEDKDFSGKSAKEIMSEALGETREDASEDYLKGAFEMLTKTDREIKVDSTDLTRVAAAQSLHTNTLDPLDEAEKQFDARRRDAWKN